MIILTFRPKYKIELKKNTTKRNQISKLYYFKENNYQTNTNYHVILTTIIYRM